jgi:hypothetical protein
MDPVSRGIALAITLVWGIVAVLSLPQLGGDTSTLKLISPIMLAALGTLAGINKITFSKKKDDDKGEE